MISSPARCACSAATLDAAAGEVDAAGLEARERVDPLHVGRHRGVHAAALQPQPAVHVDGRIRRRVGRNQPGRRIRHAGALEQRRQAVAIGVQRRPRAVDDADAPRFPVAEPLERRAPLAHREDHRRVDRRLGQPLDRRQLDGEAALAQPRARLFEQPRVVGLVAARRVLALAIQPDQSGHEPTRLKKCSAAATSPGRSTSTDSGTGTPSMRYPRARRRPRNTRSAPTPSARASSASRRIEARTR